MLSVLMFALIPLLIFLAVIVFYAYCTYRIYQRVGLPGWSAFVPIYNIYVVCYAFLSSAMTVAVCGCTVVSIIMLAVFREQPILYLLGGGLCLAAQVMYWVAWHRLVKFCGHSTAFFICTIFFSAITTPILAFEPR